MATKSFSSRRQPPPVAIDDRGKTWAIYDRSRYLGTIQALDGCSACAGFRLVNELPKAARLVAHHGGQQYREDRP